MQIKIKSILIVVLGMFLFAACDYDFIEPETPDIDPTDTLSFASDIAPVFEQDNCTACHSSSGTQFSLTSDKAYENIVALGLLDLNEPALSPIYLVPSTANPDPHPGVYSPANEALVLIWIQQGAMNN